MSKNKHYDTGASQPSSELQQLRARVAYLEARLVKAGEEGAALAASLERLSNALDPKILDWIDCGMAANNRHQETWARELRNELHQALAAKPDTTSLALLVADKQAEALEDAANDCVPQMHKMAHWLRARASEKRRQAEESRS